MPRMTATQQVNETGRRPLPAGETVWMEGLDQALVEFRNLNPDDEIHGIHSINSDQGEWHIGLRCGQAGVSYARIVLDYGYHLEWIEV